MDIIGGDYVEQFVPADLLLEHDRVQCLCRSLDQLLEGGCGCERTGMGSGMFDLEESWNAVHDVEIGRELRTPILVQKVDRGLCGERGRGVSLELVRMDCDFHAAEKERNFVTPTAASLLVATVPAFCQPSQRGGCVRDAVRNQFLLLLRALLARILRQMVMEPSLGVHRRAHLEHRLPKHKIAIHEERQPIVRWQQPPALSDAHIVILD